MRVIKYKKCENFGKEDEIVKSYGKIPIRLVIGTNVISEEKS